MAMKICKECGTEISKSAKVCPKCGKKQKKSVGVIILGIILIFIGIGLMSSGINTTTNENTVSTNISSVTENKVTKENYDKINKGMTKEQVKEIMGEPTTISENDTPGVGTMELNHYQQGFELKGIDIYYLDGKVYMKNWTEL